MAEIVKVGDFITDAFGVYEVVEIKDEQLFYQPASNTDKVYTAHLPVANLYKAGLRKVISADKASELMDQVTTDHVVEKYDFGKAKEEVYVNNPEKILTIMNYIWINQSILIKNDKELMWQIMDNLSREISFVTKQTTAKVKEKITQKLGLLYQLPQ